MGGTDGMLKYNEVELEPIEQMQTLVNIQKP
jgi:hypothetical protein